MKTEEKQRRKGKEVKGPVRIFPYNFCPTIPMMTVEKQRRKGKEVKGHVRIVPYNSYDDRREIKKERQRS